MKIVLNLRTLNKSISTIISEEINTSDNSEEVKRYTVNDKNRVVTQVWKFKRKLTKKCTPPRKEESNTNIRINIANNGKALPKLNLRQYLNRKNSQKFVNMQITARANKKVNIHNIITEFDTKEAGDSIKDSISNMKGPSSKNVISTSNSSSKQMEMLKRVDVSKRNMSLPNITMTRKT